MVIANNNPNIPLVSIAQTDKLLTGLDQHEKIKGFWVRV
jgi:hypothetical protein